MLTSNLPMWLLFGLIGFRYGFEMVQHVRNGKNGKVATFVAPEDSPRQHTDMLHDIRREIQEAKKEIVTELQFINGRKK